MTNVYYKFELENKIQDEIENNKLSINNELLEKKMIEYRDIQNRFKEQQNPSEEEKKKYLQEIFEKFFEVKNLYLDLIKENYNINNS